jgi:hypothetical protein
MDTKISLFVFCKRVAQLDRDMRTNRERRMFGEEPGMPPARRRPLHTKTNKTSERIRSHSVKLGQSHRLLCSGMTAFQCNSESNSWFSFALTGHIERKDPGGRARGIMEHCSSVNLRIFNRPERSPSNANRFSLACRDSPCESAKPATQTDSSQSFVPYRWTQILELGSLSVPAVPIRRFACMPLSIRPKTGHLSSFTFAPLSAAIPSIWGFDHSTRWYVIRSPRPQPGPDQAKVAARLPCTGNRNSIA